MHTGFTKPSVYRTSGALHQKFAVVETGTLAGKDSKAKAELKAVTDALGPIAKDSSYGDITRLLS